MSYTIQIFIYIFIIIIIYYCQIISKLNTHNNLNYLFIFTDINYLSIKKFYNIIQKYASLENLVVESSIKIGYGDYNPYRYTIPIHRQNLDDNQLLALCHEILPIDQIIIKDTIYEYIKKNLDLSKTNTDLIFGYDYLTQTYKIYINGINENMTCLEINYINLKFKHKIYELLCIQDVDLLFDLDLTSLAILSTLKLDNNVRLLYRVNNDTYHIILRVPMVLDEFQIDHIESYFNINLKKWFKNIQNIEYLIHVICIKKNRKNIDYITFYMRPHNLLIKALEITKWLRVFF